MSEHSDLRATPLAAEHLALGARMLPFAGWSMPIQYAGVLDEHRAVREHAGIFDVSHMGTVRLHGQGAAAALDRLTTWPMSQLAEGRARYTVFPNPEGGCVDDLIVYREAADRYMIIWNAANHAKNLAWTAEELQRHGVRLEDHTAETALIAVQGPAWREIMGKALPSLPLPEKRFGFVVHQDGGDWAVARTGYTGEDGVEIWLPAEHAAATWQALLAAGATPCGLGARDSLRIEAGLPLYGHELSDERDLFQAGVGFVVRFDERDFVGRAALERRRQEPGPALIGVRMLERGVPREGYPLHDAAGTPVGTITSGSFSPVLDAGIGLGLVDNPESLVHTDGRIAVRSRMLAVRYVRPPIHHSRETR